ncbi:SHOCT domain-containing protein [Thalassobacillus hwangdonensis]|uniref:SHOCT domain-containing protein n=1 Tax=Thalassobacillus hwangdonensis TaxID=546108 RepID=A0ABW3L2P2_9BACI
MHMIHGYGNSGWMIFVFMIGIIILSLVGIVLMRSYLSTDTPIEILEERFKNGEISEEEFYRIKYRITRS